MSTTAARILILGGTTQAMQLAQLLAARLDLAPIFSFAGRTQKPVLPPIPYRFGGFGGVTGLIDYLRCQRINAVVDATHPFATQISSHAAQACAALGVPLCVLTRPGWQAQAGDNWLEVDDFNAAALALGESPKRVFLTVGRLHLAAFFAAPQHHYLIRSIDDPGVLTALPRHELILSRPDFNLADEMALLQQHGIDIVVTKNSGAAATYPKLAAARALGLTVVMIKRPAATTATFELFEPAAVLEWLHQQCPAPYTPA